MDNTYPYSQAARPQKELLCDESNILYFSCK